jgi:hypothetical protein
VVYLFIIKVYNTNSDDSDSNFKNTSGIKKPKSGILAFFEDKNGKVIDYHKKRQLYAEL